MMIILLKIVFAIVASAAIIGCEEGPGGGAAGGAGGGSSINPPSWIIGTWTSSAPAGLQTYALTWTFTSNSAVHTSSSISIKFGAGGIESSGGVRLSDSTEPDGQTTRYRIFHVATGGGVTVSSTYTFEKRETDRMVYRLTQHGVTLQPLTLTKR